MKDQKVANEEAITGKVADVAKQLGTNHAVLYKLIREEKLAGTKVGRGLHVNIEEARKALISNFNLSKEQAQAILDM